MDIQDIRNLSEAYIQVYAQQELTEEVEIAAHYFYEMGLNDEGVDILIEELGVEEFGDFVSDIAEEYTLTEARAGGVRIEPVTTTGKKFKSGKPTGKSLERLRAKKAARREAEAKVSEAKPSGLKSSLQRQSAIASAKKQQPKKKGVLDRVAGAVLKGMERHNKAMSAARETGKTVGKAAKGASTVAKGFASGVELAGRIGKRVLTGEEVEAWVNSLIEEGYDLSEYTWEDMTEMYMNLDEATKAETHREKKDPFFSRRVERNNRYRKENPNAGINAQLLRQKAHASKRGVKKEETDLFDYVLEHLIAEGYADTNESALVIMANMSEEWKESIVEANKAERMLGLTSRERSRARNLNQYADKPIFYKNTKRGRGDNSDPLLNKAHKGMSAKRQASHKAGRNLRGDTGESGNVVRSRYQANKDHEDGYPSIRRIDT